MQTNSRRTKTINSKIIALNEATDRLQDPHLHLFLAWRFLIRTNVRKNRARVANHAVDGVLPFLICFEASENQSSTCCLHGKISQVFMLLVLWYLREVWRFSIPILKAAWDDIELRMLTTNRDNATWHKQGNDNDIFRKICQESLCLPQDLECELWSMYWRTLFKCTRQKAGLSMPWKTVANHFLCKEILEHRLQSSKTSWWNELHDGPPPLWCENLRPQVSQPCGQICKVIIKYSKLEQLTKCYCEQPKWWFSSTKEKG